MGEGAQALSPIFISEKPMRELTTNEKILLAAGASYLAGLVREPPHAPPVVPRGHMDFACTVNIGSSLERFIGRDGVQYNSIGAVPCATPGGPFVCKTMRGTFTFNPTPTLTTVRLYESLDDGQLFTVIAETIIPAGARSRQVDIAIGLSAGGIYCVSLQPAANLTGAFSFGVW